MHRALAALSLALAAAGLAAAARAENAAAAVLPGDTLHGNIVAPGDFDLVEVYLPAGALVDADLRQEAGSAVAPTLSLLDPEGDPVDLEGHLLPGAGGVGARLKKLPVAGGGVHVFVVTAGAASGGKYSLRVKTRDPRKAPASASLPEDPVLVLSVDAREGALLSYTVKATDGGSVTVTLEGPSGPVPGAGALKASKLDADADGTYVLEVDGPGETAPPATATILVKPPKASKRHLYLSPAGFGEAPLVTLLDPAKVLDDRPAEGIRIEGEGFDPAATVRLERKGQAPLVPSSFSVESDELVLADFDVTGIKPGKWTLIVENPSGGAGTAKLAVQAAGAVKLPDGVVKNTEVWWLDFDETEFRNDLAAIGLGSSSSSVAELAEAAVKSYALFFVRRAFGVGGAEGGVPNDDTPVPVSFTLEAPPATVGAPGVAYNRLQIGGAAAVDDPSSNPNIPWGDSPVDAGNASFDDVGRDVAPGRGVRTRALVPSGGTSTSAWITALQPFAAAPLAASDAAMFQAGYVPKSDAEMLRYRNLARALETVGKELGGVMAHFIARSMGLADGISGLSGVPAQVGEYSALTTFGFTLAEREALVATLRDPELPGTAKTLRASYLALRPTRAYLLTAAETTTAYNQSMQISGGRPDKDADDLEYAGVSGSIPLGFNFTTAGVISGTAPLFVPDQGRTLYAGVFKFVLRVTDSKSGDSILFSHRLNLLVDADNSSLTGPEQTQAQTLNAQVLATP